MVLGFERGCRLIRLGDLRKEDRRASPGIPEKSTTCGILQSLSAIIWTLGVAPKIAVGDVLDGKYKITDILGSGAMGVVYEALHTRLQRKVALKTLRAEYATNARLVERFEREARASSAIGHPNIVQIFDAGGEDAAVPYLAMERLNGENLGDLLRAQKVLGTTRAVDICCQLLEGLSAAHGAGILHRDIKPDNIFLTEDQDGSDLVKILDFGISKILDLSDSEHGEQAGGNITQVGVVVGTPNYMSPEQVCANPDIDLRADLWSVVCVLYKCLCGRAPFSGETRQQLMAATLQGEFVPLQARCPDVPLALAAIVRRGLMVDIADRYQNARALLAALRQLHLGSQADTLRNSVDHRASTEHGLAVDDSDTVIESSNLASVAPPVAESAEVASMVGAFDNLADRFMEQDAGVAPPIGASSAEKPEPAVAVAQARNVPSTNPFAPPGSEEEVSLDLDISPHTGPQPRIHDAPANEQHKEPASKSDKRRLTKRQGTITRAEQSVAGPLLLKILLALGVVACVGGGYQYLTKGYFFWPDHPTTAKLSLTISPDGARVFIDEAREFDHELSIATNEEHTVRIAAKDRIQAMATFEAEPGAAYSVSVFLGHPMFKLNDQFVAAPIEVIGRAPTASTIEVARKKLHAYGSCAFRLFNAIAELPTDAARPAALWVIDRGLTDECGTTVDLAADMKPILPAVDDPTRLFRKSISNYNKTVTAYQKSAGASREILQDRERDLSASLSGVKARSLDFRNAMSHEESKWLTLELLYVDELGGNALNSQVRHLAVSADAWMRATLTGADTSDARSGMIDYYSFLSAAREQISDEFDARGVTGYLHALEPLMANGQDKHRVALHNHAVDVFNKMRLPLHIDVERDP